jgi:hypothetical protein
MEMSVPVTFHQAKLPVTGDGRFIAYLWSSRGDGLGPRLGGGQGVSESIMDNFENKS